MATLGSVRSDIETVIDYCAGRDIGWRLEDADAILAEAASHLMRWSELARRDKGATEVVREPKYATAARAVNLARIRLASGDRERARVALTESLSAIE